MSHWTEFTPPVKVEYFYSTELLVFVARLPKNLCFLKPIFRSCDKTAHLQTPGGRPMLSTFYTRAIVLVTVRLRLAQIPLIRFFCGFGTTLRHSCTE